MIRTESVWEVIWQQPFGQKQRLGENSGRRINSGFLAESRALNSQVWADDFELLPALGSGNSVPIPLQINFSKH